MPPAPPRDIALSCAPAVPLHARIRGAEAASRRALVSATARHALFWLCAGNAVGVLLALLLVAPDLSALRPEPSYGRWVAVHLDLQLYGWSALPLVALLFHALLPRTDRRLSRAGLTALVVWSAVLIVGAVSWLSGGSSGKLFLEWSGSARWLLAIALAVLWVVLAVGYGLRLAKGGRRGEGRAPVVKLALLLFLGAVPVVLFQASDPGVYPPVNPDSGGSTGTSLLGSSLGIVAVLLLLPPLLGLVPARPDAGRRLGLGAALLAVHFAVFGLLSHGDASHHDPTQIVGLASLLVWWPLGRGILGGYRWPRASRRWLGVLGWWAAVLLVSAVAMFLPGALEGLKFTNALVAHAHLAMAGVVTALHFSILGVLLSPESGWVGERAAMARWNTGLAVMLTALVTLGALEAMDPGRMFRIDAAATVLYMVRLGAGVLMLSGSWRWWLASRRHVAEEAR